MSRRIAPFLVALAAVFGCKSVTQEPPPQELVIATFDSAVGLVPTPSDLALASSKDMPPSNQKMMLQWFVQGGGFPGEQGVAVSVPLNRWVWDDAAGHYVKDQSPATQPRIDPASVTTAGASANVIVLKVDGGPGAAPVQIDVELDAENSVSALSFTPPPEGSVIPGTVLSSRLQFHKMADANGSRRWAPGRYVFVVRGGASGVKACAGACTAASARIALSPDKPLVMVAPNLDLTNPKNQPIMKVTPEQIAQLESVRASLWNPLTWGVAGPLASGDYAWAPSVSTTITPAFVAAGRYMAPTEIAAIGTFSIAGPKPVVSVDSDSGLVPLPFDLARTGPGVFDPTTQTTVKTIGYNPAFGSAARGLTSLNGFSTTAMIFAPTSIPIDADTVNGTNGKTVYLFKKTSGGWVSQNELKAYSHGWDSLPPAVVAEPTPITTTIDNYVAAGVRCTAANCSPIVALQPAAQATPTVSLPPLDEATDYAVVITTGVMTMPIFVPQYATTLQLPLGRSAMARLLLETPADQNHMFAASVGGPVISSLSGVTPETATALQTMRQQLRFDTDNVVGAFTAASGLPESAIAMAYTFRTQSVTGTSVRIAGLPYGTSVGVTTDPDAVTTFSGEQIAAQYGVPTYAVTAQSIHEFAEVKVQTVNWLLGSQNQGLFDPAHPTTEVMTALVAVPNPLLVTASCTDSPFPAAAGSFAAFKCAPLVLFEHGITKTKAHMLLLAAHYAAQGFVVASVDQMMQGERSYCSGKGATEADAQAAADQMCCPAALCGTASTCSLKANLHTAVDFDPVDGTTIHVGICETSAGVRGRMLDHRVDDPSGVTTTLSPKGLALASGNRLLTMNFFRIRDAFRQDVIDQSALIKALAPFVPGQDAFSTHLAGLGLAVDWNKVYLVGHSGGAINATMSMAVNPRITRIVAYAPGATNIDVFANPESYYNRVLLSILPASVVANPTAYLKLLQIGKWILDPAEPANYARYIVPGHTATNPLPSPFAGSALGAIPSLSQQPTRNLLVQLSRCDTTVPNTQNVLYSGLAGGNRQWFAMTAANGMACPDAAVTHSNLIDFVTPSLTAQAQSFGAGFLADPTNPANLTSPVLPIP